MKQFKIIIYFVCVLKYMHGMYYVCNTYMGHKT